VIDEAIVECQQRRPRGQRPAAVEGGLQIVDRDDRVTLLQPVKLLREEIGRERADVGKSGRGAVAHVVVHHHQAALLENGVGTHFTNCEK